MRTVDISEATGSLSEYARQIRRGPVVVTRRGKPVAVVVAVKGLDLETALAVHQSRLHRAHREVPRQLPGERGALSRSGAPQVRTTGEGSGSAKAGLARLRIATRAVPKTALAMTTG